MASGFWTSVSGAGAQAQNVDIISNNLANSDTPAFKKDMPAFREYLATVETEHDTVDVPHGPIRDRDLYPIDGRDQSHVVMVGTYVDHRQGHLKVTENPFDLAVDGPGFFEVSTPSGVRYTRQGSFKLATDGRLVTREGYPVLMAQPGGLAAALPAAAVQPNPGGLTTQGGVAAGQGGGWSDAAARFVNLRDAQNGFSVSPAGDIFAGETLVGRLALTEFADLKKLRKLGGALFESRDPGNVSTTPSRSSVRQGMIETSNVNPVEEMSDLIRAHRLFEHDLKAMKTYGDLLGKEANDIGKL